MFWTLRYASKLVALQEGDAAGAAYLILEGSLLVSCSCQDNTPIPLFEKDMWIGERSLINPRVRRSGSCFTTSFTTLMLVPGIDFRIFSRPLEWGRVLCVFIYNGSP